jgi:hypothetical protein
MNNGSFALDSVLQEQKILTEAGKQPSPALRDSRIDLDAEILPAEVAIYVINNDGVRVPICSLGNIATVIGKAKAKKTFYVSMLVASFLSEWQIGKLQGSARAGKDHAILIDSEQSAYHTQKVGKRIAFLANLKDPNKLHVYGLRRYTYSERLKLVEEALDIHPHAGLMVIDGIRDLLADINDASESSILVGTLMRWSEVYNIHILCILHQNKGDSNARGHLGTEVVNKSETVLSVTRDEKNKSISVVEPEYCRDREPDRIIFQIDERGMPEMIDEVPDRSQSMAISIKNPSDIDVLTHRDILVRAFETVEKPKRSDLAECIKTVLIEKNIRYTKDDLSAMITWYLMNKHIRQLGTPNTRHSWFELA